MERFQLIKEFLNKNIDLSIPVLIQKIRVYHDNETNYKFLQVKLSNYSTQTVKEIVFKVNNLDTTKEEFLKWDNLRLPPNHSISNEKPIYFETNYDTGFEVTITEVKTSDNNSLKSNNNIKKIKLRKAIITSKIVLKDKEVTLPYKPLSTKQYWRCGCGHINDSKILSCTNCKIEKTKSFNVFKTTQKKVQLFGLTILSSILLVPLIIQIPNLVNDYFSDYKYVRFENGYALKEYNGDLEKVVIPNEYRNLPIVSIHSNAFIKAINIKELVLPDSLNTLPDGALACLPKIESLTLPFVGNSINYEINNKTFLDLFLQNGCDDMFSEKSYRTQFGASTYIVPESLKILTITEQAVIKNFIGFDSITTINLGPKFADYLEDLHDLPKLINVNVAQANRVFSSIDGVLYNYDKSIIYYYSNNRTDSSYSFNNNLKEISNSAFNGNVYLKQLVIPDSVRRISQGALNGINLTDLTVPFIGWDRLDNNYIAHFFADYNSIKGTTSYNNSVPSTLINITVTDTTSVISENFQFANSIESISFSSKTISIDKNAFDNLINLKSINFLDKNSNYRTVDGVLYSGDMTILIKFPVAKYTVNFAIPTSVTKIESNALQNSRYIEILSVPASVNSIEKGSFKGLSYLKAITVPFIGKTRSSNEIEGVIGHFFGQEAYFGAVEVKQVYIFGNDEKNNHSFYIPQTLKEVNVIDATQISAGAFSRVNSLSVITLNEGIKTINDLAFFATNSLLSLSIPKSVTTIGNGVFQRAGLREIFFPNAIVNMGWVQFYENANLKEIRVQFLSRPSGWNQNWNEYNYPVIWNQGS
jgi:hypothetical protein